MEKNKIITMLILLIFCYGCKEEYIGQYPVDNTPPAAVSNIRVQNLPGKVILTYQLPKEDDLFYVKAMYVMPDGTRREMASSAYSNTIECKGFGKSAKYTIELISVDKSYNESSPVSVEVEPLDSPIYDVLKTLQYQESFGGIKVQWKNPLKEDIVFDVLKKDESGKYSHIETIYSSETTPNRAIRGLDPEPTDFAFYFRDTYDNYTDTVFVRLAPFYEAQLDKKMFSALRLSSKFTLHSYGGSMDRMWDDIYTVDNNLYYVNVGPEKVYFAFDMGVEAKLSRFRLWTRRNYMYQLHHLREFEIWGTSDASATTDPDNWDGWVKIMACESIRPSGQTEGGNLTSEEEQYLLAGEEFEVPIEAPKFRYMKIRVNKTWGNTEAAFISEITIWGDTK